MLGQPLKDIASACEGGIKTLDGLQSIYHKDAERVTTGTLIALETQLMSMAQRPGMSHLSPLVEFALRYKTDTGYQLPVREIPVVPAVHPGLQKGDVRYSGQHGHGKTRKAKRMITALQTSIKGRLKRFTTNSLPELVIAVDMIADLTHTRNHDMKGHTRAGNNRLTEEDAAACASASMERTLQSHYDSAATEDVALVAREKELYKELREVSQRRLQQRNDRTEGHRLTLMPKSAAMLLMTHPSPDYHDYYQGVGAASSDARVLPFSLLFQDTFLDRRQYGKAQRALPRGVKYYTSVAVTEASANATRASSGTVSAITDSDGASHRFGLDGTAI